MSLLPLRQLWPVKSSSFGDCLYSKSVQIQTFLFWLSYFWSKSEFCVISVPLANKRAPLNISLFSQPITAYDTINAKIEWFSGILEKKRDCIQDGWCPADIFDWLASARVKNSQKNLSLKTVSEFKIYKTLIRWKENFDFSVRRGRNRGSRE